ncbi:glutathione peroxidase 7-like [Etheostoma cragini]|uniref:glutathione peroxidase 7-like n=1 Tax=Etheostoma cragini TaxID=417921 RepID=UPI00155E0848|nr:glutathione peroxidase 7-like [Etheostoma cragini]
MLPRALAVLISVFSLTESKQKDLYTFKVVNSRGKLVSLEKYRGSVSLDLNSVLNCEGCHFFFFFHTSESSGKEPDWNFWKYLIDVNGKVVDAWGPKVSVKEIQPKIAEMVRQIILKKKEEL